MTKEDVGEGGWLLTSGATLFTTSLASSHSMHSFLEYKVNTRRTCLAAVEAIDQKGGEKRRLGKKKEEGEDGRRRKKKRPV